MQVRAAKGSIAAALSFVVNLTANIVQVSLVLEWWSKEQYGSWLAVVAVAGLISSLESGHLQYVGNKMNAEWHTDRDQLRRTLGSSLRVVVVTGILQLLLLVALGVSGGLGWIDGGATASGNGILTATLLYTLGNIVFGSVASVVVRLLAVGGLFVRGALWGIVIRGLQLCAVCLAAYADASTVQAVLLYHLFGGAVATFVYLDLKRLFPDLWPWWRHGGVREGGRNLLKSSVLMFSSGLDNASNQGLVVLIGSLLGAASIPLFTTVRTLANLIGQGASFLLNPIQPDLIRFGVERDVSKLIATFRIYWILVGSACLCVVCPGLYLVEPLYRLWTRGVLEFDAWLLSTLALSVVVRVAFSPFYMYLSSMNRLREQLNLSIVRTLSVVVVAFLLSENGLVGFGAAILISEVLASGLLPAWLVCRELSCMTGRAETAIIAAPLTIAACCALALVCFLLADSWLLAIGIVMPTIAVAGVVHEWHRLDCAFRLRLLGSLSKLFGRT